MPCGSASDRCMGNFIKTRHGNLTATCEWPTVWHSNGSWPQRWWRSRWSREREQQAPQVDAAWNRAVDRLVGFADEDGHAQQQPSQAQLAAGHLIRRKLAVPFALYRPKVSE